MPVYLSNTTRIAKCDRCSFKVPYDELRPDGNSPGLRVCEKCWDELDPYRLPARKTEKYTLRYPRPDTPLGNQQIGLSTQEKVDVVGDEKGNWLVIGETGDAGKG